MLEYKILPENESKKRIEYSNKILKINQAKIREGYTPKCFVVTFGCQQNVADS